MTMIKYGALALVLAAGVSLAGTAQAQLLDAATGIDVGANVGTGNAAVDVSTDVRATSSVADTDTATGTDAEADTRTSLDTAGTLNFTLDRKSMEGTEYSVSEAEAVQTAAGLESYAATSIRDDERLESVHLEDGTLEMTYRMDARFLGFIPGSMDVRATVTADGTVDVRYPWYAFLMRAHESRADLEARVAKEQEAIADDLAEASASVNADTAELRRWALALERLRMSLHATASAEAQR